MVHHSHLDDESFLRRGLSALPPTPGAPGADPCLDSNLLAGLAAGRLLPAEREAVEAHLAVCDACRGLALRMAPERPSATNWPKDARPGSRLRVWWLAAAAILVGGIVWAWGETPPADVQLVAQAERLRQQEPDLLADLVPLDHGERLRPREGAVRGGPLRLIWPAGTILETRPQPRWESPERSGSVVVSMRAADGSVGFRETVDGQTLAFPESAASLAPGTSYEWSITDRRRLASSELAFRVADEAQHDRVVAALRTIRASAPPEFAELLCAHFALRHHVLAEAEAAARRALTLDAQDHVARETLYQVLVRLGSAEAEQVLVQEKRP